MGLNHPFNQAPWNRSVRLDDLAVASFVLWSPTGKRVPIHDTNRYDMSSRLAITDISITGQAVATGNLRLVATKDPTGTPVLEDMVSFHIVSGTTINIDRSFTVPLYVPVRTPENAAEATRCSLVTTAASLQAMFAGQRAVATFNGFVFSGNSGGGITIYDN